MTLKSFAAVLVAAGLCATASAAPAAGFADPLDAPAQASALASSRLLNGIARAGKRVVAVGQRGHILLSDDQGQTWRTATVPVSVDLLAVSFPTPTHGWVVGHGGVVLATQDGGQTWTRQLDGRAVAKLLLDRYVTHPAADLALDGEALSRFKADVQRLAEEGPDKPFLDVWFDDEKTGYVVGSFNLVLRTTDGGRTWVPMMDRADNPRALHLFAVRRIDGAMYITGEQGLVMKLDADGQHWRALPLDYKGTLFGATGVAGSPGVVLVHGLRGNVFRSGDGGSSWTKVETGAQGGLTGSAITREGRLLVLSQAGEVLTSSDAGRSFARLPTRASARPVPASAGLALDDGSLLVVGPRGARLLPQMASAPPSPVPSSTPPQTASTQPQR